MKNMMKIRDIGYLQGRNNNKYTKITEDKYGQNITDRQTNDRYKHE